MSASSSTARSHRNRDRIGRFCRRSGFTHAQAKLYLDYFDDFGTSSSDDPGHARVVLGEDIRVGDLLFDELEFGPWRADARRTVTAVKATPDDVGAVVTTDDGASRQVPLHAHVMVYRGHDLTAAALADRSFLAEPPQGLNSHLRLRPGCDKREGTAVLREVGITKPDADEHYIDVTPIGVPVAEPSQAEAVAEMRREVRVQFELAAFTNRLIVKTEPTTDGDVVTVRDPDYDGQPAFAWATLTFGPDRSIATVHIRSRSYRDGMPPGDEDLAPITFNPENRDPDGDFLEALNIWHLVLLSKSNRLEERLHRKRPPTMEEMLADPDPDDPRRPEADHFASQMSTRVVWEVCAVDDGTLAPVGELDALSPKITDLVAEVGATCSSNEYDDTLPDGRRYAVWRIDVTREDHDTTQIPVRSPAYAPTLQGGNITRFPYDPDHSPLPVVKVIDRIRQRVGGEWFVAPDWEFTSDLMLDELTYAMYEPLLGILDLEHEHSLKPRDQWVRAHYWLKSPNIWIGTYNLTVDVPHAVLSISAGILLDEEMVKQLVEEHPDRARNFTSSGYDVWVEQPVVAWPPPDDSDDLVWAVQVEGPTGYDAMWSGRNATNDAAAPVHFYVYALRQGLNPSEARQYVEETRRRH